MEEERILSITFFSHVTGNCPAVVICRQENKQIHIKTEDYYETDP